MIPIFASYGRWDNFGEIDELSLFILRIKSFDSPECVLEIKLIQFYGPAANVRK